MSQRHLLPAARFTTLVALVAVVRPDSLPGYAIAVAALCLVLVPDALAARRAPRPAHSPDWRRSAGIAGASDDFTLGYALLRAGRAADAEPWLRRAVETDGSDADARLNLGIALAECGRHAEAIAELEAATRLRPRDASAHFRLGVSAAAEGSHFAAIHALREAVRLDPRHAAAARTLDSVEATLSPHNCERAAPGGHPARAKRASGSTVRAS